LTRSFPRWLPSLLVFMFAISGCANRDQTRLSFEFEIKGVSFAGLSGTTKSHDLDVLFTSKGGKGRNVRFECKIDAEELHLCQSPWKIRSIDLGIHNAEIWIFDGKKFDFTVFTLNIVA
jgi:hypothetical protein